MGIVNIEDKELAISLNTNDQDTFTTPIQGILDSLIIDSNQKVQVIIESELGYLIFHRHEFEGVEYFAPRVRAVAQYSDVVGLQDIPTFDRFNLNERIIITILGPKDSEVTLTLRLL